MLSNVPLPIQAELRNALQTELISFSFASGGCINHGGKLTTQAGDFFLKWNDSRRFPKMFDAEARGLKLLRKPNVIDVPEAILHSDAGSFQFLLLEFVESHIRHSLYWETLGEQLAALHRISSESFGLDHNNYIGSLRQENSPIKNWIDFFIERRLVVQEEMAINAGKLPSETSKQFAALYKKLSSLLSSEKPSLLHGDLWSDNLITNAEGKPCVIDPAVYYGNREIELAFTELFGGFSEVFYDAYNAHFKLLPGYRERVTLYQLYPLLVHVNLFGSGYVSQVVSILKKFV